MAKSTNEAVKAQRNALITVIKEVTGVALKRSATATGGLAVSNKDMWANGLAHLLCNEKNFQTVAALLPIWDSIKDGDFIPEKFNSTFDFASVLYACGTAPRIVSNKNRHVSKDAAMKGGVDSQEFIAFAQAWRMKVAQNDYIGLSRSVHKAGTGIMVDERTKNGMVYEDYFRMDSDIGSGELDESWLTEQIPAITSDMQKAIDIQKRMKELLSTGGVLAINRLSTGKSLSDFAQEMKNRQLAKEKKPEVAATETVPAVTKTGGKKRGKAAKAA